MIRRLALGAVALAAAPAAAAQGVAEAMGRVASGEVHFHYAAREGVCGNGRNLHFSGLDNDAGRPDCDRGPVYVTVLRAGGVVQDVEVEVGGPPPTLAGTRLGQVGAADAAHSMLRLARTTADSSVARDALTAAALADSVEIWPELLAMARDRGLGQGTRTSALFWVSHLAGERVVREMGRIAEDATEDREIRQMAVFALGRRPADEGVPALLRVARNDRDPEVRRMAIFWLGRSGDPRAISYFEEVLGGS